MDKIDRINIEDIIHQSTKFSIIWIKNGGILVVQNFLPFLTKTIVFYPIMKSTF